MDGNWKPHRRHIFYEDRCVSTFSKHHNISSSCRSSNRQAKLTGNEHEEAMLFLVSFSDTTTDCAIGGLKSNSEM